MVILFVFVLLVIFVIFIVKNKIVIRFDTFFRKGFEKIKDIFGVYCFTGKQGDGKTYSVVDFLNEIKKKGQIVLSNVKSYCDNHKEDSIYCPDFEDIMRLCEESEEYGKKYIIFFDEIFTYIEKGKLTKQQLSFLSQMRKRGLILLTTAQEWLEINITFRRYVRYQIECSMLNLPLINRAFSINKIKDAYQMKWDNLENEYVCPIIKTTFKKCSLELANSYDTYETIETSKK